MSLQVWFEWFKAFSVFNLTELNNNLGSYVQLHRHSVYFKTTTSDTTGTIGEHNLGDAFDRHLFKILFHQYVDINVFYSF